MDIIGNAGLRPGNVPASPELPRAAAVAVQASAFPVVADNGINVTSTKAVPPLPPSDADVKRSIDVINKYLTPVSDDIQFMQDSETGQVLVKVVDTATGKVIRQIPTEQVVEISKDLGKLQGLLVRDKA